LLSHNNEVTLHSQNLEKYKLFQSTGRYCTMQFLGFYGGIVEVSVLLWYDTVTGLCGAHPRRTEMRPELLCQETNVYTIQGTKYAYNIGRSCCPCEGSFEVLSLKISESNPSAIRSTLHSTFYNYKL